MFPGTQMENLGARARAAELLVRRLRWQSPAALQFAADLLPRELDALLAHDRAASAGSASAIAGVVYRVRLRMATQEADRHYRLIKRLRPDKRPSFDAERGRSGRPMLRVLMDDHEE